MLARPGKAFSLPSPRRSGRIVGLSVLWEVLFHTHTLGSRPLLRLSYFGVAASEEPREERKSQVGAWVGLGWGQARRLRKASSLKNTGFLLCDESAYFDTCLGVTYRRDRGQLSA